MNVKWQKRLLFLLILAFVILAFCVKGNFFKAVDQSIETTIAQWQQPMSTVCCKTLSLMGKWYVYAGFSCILFLYPRTRMTIGYPLALILIFSVTFNKLLKTAFAIERPFLFALTSAHGYSFPSGHAMYGLAFLGMVLILLKRMQKNKVITVLADILAILFLLLVGFSRIYLGIHHPSDVLCGYLAGSIILLAFCIFYPNPRRLTTS